MGPKRLKELMLKNDDVHATLVRLLLNKILASGITPQMIYDDVDTEGKNAVMYALAADHPPIVAIFLAHESLSTLYQAGQTEELKPHWIEHQNASGQTLAALAAMDNNVVALKTLIKFGANYNRVDRDGLTPFLHAAKKGAYTTLNHIYAQGRAQNIDLLDQKNRLNQNAIFLACQEGHKDAAHSLMDKWAEEKRVQWVRDHGRLGLFDMALNADWQNQRDATGLRPLAIASYNGYADIVELICTFADSASRRVNGALEENDFIDFINFTLNPTVPGLEEYVLVTPLQCACIRGHLGVVQQLLKHKRYIGLGSLNRAADLITRSLQIARNGGNAENLENKLKIAQEMLQTLQEAVSKF